MLNFYDVITPPLYCRIQDDTKKRELLKNLTKIEEIQEKKFIGRNWTITTWLLRDSNPNYQCLKITSCRWRPPPRMHSFTATTHFKSSRSFVSLCTIISPLTAIEMGNVVTVHVGRGGRSIFSLILDLSHRWNDHHAPAVVPSRNNPVPIEAGWVPELFLRIWWIDKPSAPYRDSNPRSSSL